MDDQKIENILNLALNTTETEREKSESLDVGYNARTRTWQVIVRYHSDLIKAALPGWEVTLLTGGYAIVRLPQTEVNLLASLPEIEYVEKPKLLYFSVNQGRASSCVSALQAPAFDLFGTGTLVALIDSGVDYFHPDFRNEDGSSRILAIWDQTADNSGLLPDSNPLSSGLQADFSDSVQSFPESRTDFSDSVQSFSESRTDSSDSVQSFPESRTDSPAPEAGRMFSYAPPAGFSQGIEYTKEMIDSALAADSRAAALQIVPESDASGHGTNVLGIAAGNGTASGGRYRGMAPQASILVVKLGNPEEGGFPRTVEVMQAVEYVIRKAQEFDMPVSVNLSFGNTYGSHRGTSLLETYLNMMADRWKNVIVAGTGNEGNSAGHFSAKLENGFGTLSGARAAADAASSLTVEFAVSDYEPTMNLQLWKNYADEFLVTLTHPNGETAGPFGREMQAAGTDAPDPAAESEPQAWKNNPGISRYRLGNTELLVYYGQPSPYQGLQEIYFEFLPANTYLDSGIWKLTIEPRRIVSGEFDIWMPDSRARNEATRFLRPTPDTTLTIPSTASRLISVGAYDSRRMTYAPFSGRGRESEAFYIRPDLAAPGVGITTTAPGGGYATVSGTSFAAPFVTGSAALLMEWGIVKGNDPYLYGEKLRASLNRGARQLTAEKTYPNPRLGYGALCARDSLPK